MSTDLNFSALTYALLKYICLNTYACLFFGAKKQVGSNSSKQLTPAQVLHRVRTLSGNAGDALLRTYKL